VTRWVWDPRKAVGNLRKHGFTFELAAMTLDDPLSASRRDRYPFEERWQTIGRPLLDSDLLLFVVHTAPVMLVDGESEGRIISARKAERSERRAYEEGSF